MNAPLQYTPLLDVMREGNERVESGGCAPAVVVSPARMFRLTIPGEPVAKARPKLGTVNGHAMAFTPAKTRRYEDVVRQTAVQAWQGRALLAEVAIDLAVTFTRGIPPSWSKKKRAAALNGELHPTGRPDLDNLCKAVTDGMNSVVFYDDSLIVSMTARKRYGEVPGVIVVLTWVSEALA